MRIAATVSRYLMGLAFVVFGLNGFLMFLPAPPMPGLAGQFMTVMFASHYMVPVFIIQLLCGVMFLANFRVPLALTLIAPVIFNILVFHITMNPEGIVPGLVVTVCWFLVFLQHRAAFSGILGEPQPVVVR